MVDDRHRGLVHQNEHEIRIPRQKSPKNHTNCVSIHFAGKMYPLHPAREVKLGRMTSLEGRMTKMDLKIEISTKDYPLTYVKVPPSPLGGDLWRYSNPKWRISVFSCQTPNGEFQLFFCGRQL